MTGFLRQATLVAVFVTLCTVVAACGGGSSGSSNPNSTSYDPANTTLKAAGLEVCSEEQSQKLPYEPGAQYTKKFFVAPDCNGKETSPNVVAVYQYSSLQAVDAGYAAIKAAMPKNAAIEKYGPLVIVLNGPNSSQYMASINQALKATQGGNQPATTT